MLALLLKVVFSIVCTLSNLVTWLIFTATAYLLVLLIHAFKVPGEALQGGLEQLAEAIKGCVEYLLGLIIELAGSLISSGFNLLIEAVTSSASISAEAFGTLVEKTQTSVEALLEVLSEIAEGFSEMISTVVTELWDNYKSALEYVTENA